MVKTILLIIGIVVSAFSVNRDSLISVFENQKSKQQITTYENANFNFSYKAPLGWSFATPLISIDGSFLWFTVKNPSYQVSIFIFVYKKNTAVDAVNAIKASCYDDMVFSMQKTPTMVGYIDYAKDTTYPSGMRTCWQKIRFTDTHDFIMYDYCDQSGNYSKNISYITMVNDDNINGMEYFKHVLNAGWLSNQVNTVSELNKKDIEMTVLKNDVKINCDVDADIKIRMYDMMGRKFIERTQNGKNGVSVQFPAIGPGQYFIEAISGNKKMVKKIIK